MAFGILILALSLQAQPAPEDPAPILADGDSAFTQEVLDQTKIRALYNNGDFDLLIDVLEGFMKRNKAFPASDSVFIAKYLAVVYTANKDTREKGKYYMYRLLELLPSAKLVDMFVSDEVDRIFDKVKEEFRIRPMKGGVEATAQAGSSQPAKGEVRPASLDTARSGSVDGPNRTGGKTQAGYWIAGGSSLFALVGGVTAYLLLSQEKGPERNPGPMNVTIVTPKD